MNNGQKLKDDCRDNRAKREIRSERNTTSVVENFGRWMRLFCRLDVFARSRTVRYAPEVNETANFADFSTLAPDTTVHLAFDQTLAGAFLSSRSDPIPGWKRTIDIVCTFIALPILAICTLFMTIVIKLTSPGPVFFRQERIGHLGRRFKCYKFRTMHVGADIKSHQVHCENLIRSNRPLLKMDSHGDPRLIPGGWLLRASGLDELPQIINVLRGDMSLVGPRPCVPYEHELYLLWHRERFAVLPGLTGLWQVSGKNRTTFEEMIRLDIYYVRHKSLWLDLKIMVLTLPALLQQISDAQNTEKLPVPPAPPLRANEAVAASKASIGTS
jgi:lipopolysaccharide/colanic/teichoic acid biosynthesis glycosyltransferase